MQVSLTNLVEVVSLEETKLLLKIGDTTLEKYRKEHWIQGIHYFQPEPGAKITYNKPMILVWLIGNQRKRGKG
jgi:hypothetical protein